MPKGRATPKGRITRAAAWQPAALRKALLQWFDRHQRDLPWRRTRDPYAIWVSEVMLQQTQVATVLPYFERWLERFPSVTALAAADEQTVLQAWQGLGYYARARRLLAGARAVRDRHQGRLPATRESLRALPGIGPYSAGAIASIAFDLPEPLVDGNVARVLTRLFALHGDPSRSPLKSELWQLAKELVSEERPGAFNQALMELGATVCTPRRPACKRCPVSRRCRVQKLGEPERFPELDPRKPTTRVRMLAVVATRGRRLLVFRRPDGAPRWAGLWGFPSAELERGEPLADAAARVLLETAALVPGRANPLGVARHAVTRFRLEVQAVACPDPSGRVRRDAGADVRWVSQKELETLPMSSLDRKVLSLSARDRRTHASRPRRLRAATDRASPD